METFTYELKKEQADLLRNLSKEITDFENSLKLLVANLNTKKKSLDDLLSMLCLTAGLDKHRVQVDLEKNIITQEIIPDA